MATMEKQQHKEEFNKEDFYISTFVELREQKKDLEKQEKTASDWLKEYMNEHSYETLSNENYTIKLSETTTSEVKASDLMKELGIKIPKKTEDMVDDLFKVNQTEAKKKLGALTMNKMLNEGKTFQRLSYKKND